jgi:bacteriochlorophyllide a dehydrogenase
MRIRAGVVDAPFEGRLAEVETRDPGPGDVVIRTEYSFVSNGTEQHTHRREFPEPPAAFPMAMGYQCVGRIEQVGADVKGLAAGQRVFTRQNKLAGIANPIGGVHAERALAAAENVIPVPEDADPLAVSALVVAQVGYNTAHRFPEAPGATALVLGDGIIGQFTAQAMAARGFRVLLAGHHEYRLDLARAACPALGIVNSTHPEYEKRIKDFAGERMDMAVDSVGTAATMAEVLKRAKTLGHVAIPGYQAAPQVMDTRLAARSELTVHFPAGATRQRLLNTMELIRAGTIQVAPLVTHRFDGADFGQACRLLGDRSAKYLGIALVWQKG